MVLVLTVMVAEGHVVLCGAHANGHPWTQFLSGQFDRRKLIVLRKKDPQEISEEEAVLQLYREALGM